MLGAEGLRMAERPLGVLPALASLVVLVLFESLMLVPATGMPYLPQYDAAWQKVRGRCDVVFCAKRHGAATTLEGIAIESLFLQTAASITLALLVACATL